MQINQGNQQPTTIAPRVFDEHTMILDFQYEMAQKLILKLHQFGLITDQERDQIQKLNKKTFSPLYKEIMVQRLDI